MIPLGTLAAAGSTSRRIFATLNPADKGSDAGIVLSAGNLRGTVGPSGIAARYYLARATQGKSSGKWYWETLIFRAGGYSHDYTYGSCVLCGPSYAMEQESANYPGLTADVVGGPYFGDGTYVGGTRVKTFATMTGSEVVRHMLDMDNGTYQQAFGSGEFTVAASGLTGPMFPAVMMRRGEYPETPAGYAQCNFGASAFTYSVPSGYASGLYQTGP